MSVPSRTYDIQRDYVDKLAEQEKVNLFQSLSEDIQEPADKLWLETNTEYPYSQEFMSQWISDHYVPTLTKYFDDQEYLGHDGWQVELKDGSKGFLLAPVCFPEIPREVTFMFVLQKAGINPLDVVDSLFVA